MMYIYGRISERNGWTGSQLEKNSLLYKEKVTV